MIFKNYDQLILNGKSQDLQKKRKDILEIFSAALESVNPYVAVQKHLQNNMIVFDEKKISLSDFKNIYVIGFGKASVGMAQAICDFIKIKNGAIVTNDPKAHLSTEKIEITVGGHPIPDEGSIQGAQKILEIAKDCKKNDLLIVLVSGGGSALLCHPRISLKDLQKTTDLLLKSGADINEINTIRKHLSFVKGGQLVKDVNCKVISFIISDIMGDPLDFISSGPTVADSTTFQDAENILVKYNLYEKIPEKVVHVINEGLKGVIKETPKKENPIFKNVFNFIVANNEIACKAAEEKAKEIGYNSKLLATNLSGEAKEVGKKLIFESDKINKKPLAIITGGETTVTITGNGKGGRNQELVLGILEDISQKNIVFGSFATDGIDGKSDAAGSIADQNSLKRAEEHNLNPIKFLEENNSYQFFYELKDLLFTGPTGTNVMDIQVLIK